jgi:hypothetical protein
VVKASTAVDAKIDYIRDYEPLQLRDVNCRVWTQQQWIKKDKSHSIGSFFAVGDAKVPIKNDDPCTKTLQNLGNFCIAV